MKFADKKYNLISVSHLFYPSTGGVQVISENLQKHLTEVYNLKCLTITVNTNVSEFSHKNIDCVQVPGKLMFGGDYSLPRLTFFSTLMKYLKLNPQAKVLIHGRHFPTSVLAVITCKLLGRKYLYVEHGFSYSAYNSNFMHVVLWLLDKFVFWIVPRFATTIVTNSENTKQMLIRQLGGSNRRAIAIQNGFNDNLLNLSIDNKEKIVVWAGRLTTVKDPATVLRAYASLSSQFPTWKFYLIGSGDLVMESLIGNLNLSPNIIVKSEFLPQAELHQLLSRSSIYINSSLSEGFAMATSEAAVLGNMVIVSAVQANVEWINHTQLDRDAEGYIFQTRNVSDLIRVLSVAINNAEKVVPANIRKKLTVLTNSHQFAKYFTLLEEL